MYKISYFDTFTSSFIIECSSTSLLACDSEECLCCSDFHVNKLNRYNYTCKTQDTYATRNQQMTVNNIMTTDLALTATRRRCLCGSACTMQPLAIWLTCVCRPTPCIVASNYVPRRLGLCWSRVPGLLPVSTARHQWTTNMEQSASRS